MTQGHGSAPSIDRRDRADSAAGSAPDPIFADLFADEPPSVTGPEAGEPPVGRGVLRPYAPVDETVLAELAAESALVTEALALAQWVGAGRSLSADRTLRPADASAALAALSPIDQPDPGRSASELPALWTAAVAAGLIQVTESTATMGESVRLWAGPPAAPRAKLDCWGRLVVGLLRARTEANLEQDAVGGLGLASAPLYYTLARDPMPAALPALVLATAGDDEDDAPAIDPIWMFAQLPPAVDSIARDWTWAGVLKPVEDLSAEDVEALDELFDDLAGEPDETDPIARLLNPLVEAVQASPIVQLTALGAYGLRRALLAHGWRVPLVGDAAGLSADKLLDLLVAYLPEDALTEATLWLEARGPRWENALRQVAASARSKNPAQGPGRRAALGMLLRETGPRVVTVLDALSSDPWLSAVAADARFELGLGPEPTLSEELWLIVDGLSTALDADDEEGAEAVEDSGVLEFLHLPGALAAATALTHPHTRYVLQLIIEVGGDQQLAHHLRRALEPGSTRPGSGRGRKQPRRR